MKALVLLLLVSVVHANAAVTDSVRMGCRAEKQSVVIDANIEFWCSDGTGASGAGFPNCHTKALIDGIFHFEHRLMFESRMNVQAFIVTAPNTPQFGLVRRDWVGISPGERAIDFSIKSADGKVEYKYNIICPGNAKK